MNYRIFDCNINDFTGEVIDNQEDVQDFLNFDEEDKYILLPEISYKENELTFEEWIKAIVDAENDIVHGCKEAERDLYDLQDEYPKFFEVWHDAIYKSNNLKFYCDLQEC